MNICTRPCTMCSFKSFINLQRKQAHMIAYGCTSKIIIPSFFLHRKRYETKKKLII